MQVTRVKKMFSLSLMTIRKWHWMSAALCFSCLLLFSITGIVLHHSKEWLPKPVVTHVKGLVPSEILSLLPTLPSAIEKAERIEKKESERTQERNITTRDESKKNSLVPKAFAQWFLTSHKIDVVERSLDIRERKFFIQSSQPGVTKNLSVNPETGEFDFEITDRGFMGYLNDLHKGKGTGKAWIYFIDLFAVSCIVFSITGFLLLQRYADTRSKTWPIFAAGFLLPLFFMVFIIH